MRLAIALLCSALMMSGCSDVSDAQRDLSRLLSPEPTSPPKKASLASPKMAPAKPTAGPGASSRNPALPKCADVDQAAYKALEKPEPLPPAKRLLSPEDLKRWIDAQDDQIKDLKGHLRNSTTALSNCHKS